MLRLNQNEYQIGYRRTVASGDYRGSHFTLSPGEVVGSIRGRYLQLRESAAHDDDGNWGKMRGGIGAGVAAGQEAGKGKVNHVKT